MKAELDDLKKGLEELGVLNLLQQNPITFRALFVATHDVLTAENIQDIFKPFYSPTGSNRREHEEEVIMYWISLLQEIEGQLSIGVGCCCGLSYFRFWRCNQDKGRTVLHFL